MPAQNPCGCRQLEAQRQSDKAHADRLEAVLKQAMGEWGKAPRGKAGDSSE